MADKANQVKTTEFRMSFPSLIKPRQRKNDNGAVSERYELTMLFPPGTNLTPLKAALRAAMVAKYGDDTKKWPRLKHGPAEVIRDFEAYNNNSDKPIAGDWKGWTIVRANATKYAPQVFAAQKDSSGRFPVVTDEREVYGGRWAKALLNAFTYARQDGKGVTFGLEMVQLLKRDKKFGGAVSAPEEVFDNASDEWAGNADAFDSGAQQSNATAEEEATW